MSFKTFIFGWEGKSSLFGMDKIISVTIFIIYLIIYNTLEWNSKKV